ncbi:GNAT family N-acetyltransferase [Sphingomonas sp. PB4P5]|uniref:GNAT family N-acetyltransferase n=1 Tax=Parasphingomonas puruogangriensis TaxID=3096155 RepID=UPI002FC96EDE
MDYEVDRYHGGRDDEVAALILSIQNDEAGLNLTVADQPDLLDVAASYRDGGFWIAQHDGSIVGTIGLLNHGGRGALKKFFVAPEHRGPGGPAMQLFTAVLNAARARGHHDLFLDTPSVASRSHAFYRRVGFVECSRSTLPRDYQFPDRDSLIFRRPI